MIDDNNQDRSQSEGQEGIDRETELRNRENETGQTGGESSTGETGSEKFVGSNREDSSDYLTQGEQNQDFAAQGQGPQDSDAGRSDIETGQSIDRDSEIDDGSDTNP